MTETVTFPTLELAAQALGEEFEQFRRPNDDKQERHWKLADSAAPWMRNVVRTAHTTDMLPDDWRYSIIHDCVCIVEEAGTDETYQQELLDGDVSTTYHELAHWLGSHPDRFGFCNEAMQDASYEDVAQLLSAGQYREREEVLRRLIRALEDHIDPRKP